MIRLIFILLSILLLSFSSNAAKRYWRATSNSNWNNTANWSTSSGGTGGASVPSSSDYVIFDVNSTGTCTLDISVTVAQMKMTAGTLNTSTYNFTVSGASSCTFSGGTINGNNTFVISLTGTAAITFSGTTFNPDIHAEAPRILLRGSTFNNTSYFEKTAGTNDNGTGGNTFVGNCTIKNTGTANFNLGSNGDDSFSSDLTVDNSSTSNIYIAYNNSNTTIGGNLIVNSNGACVNTGISHNGTSSVSITGNCTVNVNTTETSKTYLGHKGSISINGTLSITNGGSDNSTIYLANNSTSTATIGGTTTIVNNGTGNSKRIFLGSKGDATFNNTLKITNSSTATSSYIYCNYDDNSLNNYNGNIVLEVNNSNSDGITFGSSNGQGVLDNGKTITIGALGFSAGTLLLKNFTQNGTTTQNITTTGTSKFNQSKNEWNGNVVFKAPRITTTETSYKGTASLEKTGDTDDNLGDNNIYKENATITNSSGYRLIICRNDPDTYEKNLSITNSGTDEIFFGQVASNIQVLGNLTVNNTNNAKFIRVANTSTSNVTISGTTTITNSSVASISRIYFGYDGDITTNGNCTFNNEPTGDKGYIYIAHNENSSAVIKGNVVITNKNGLTDKRVYFGNKGDITLNGNLSIINTATADNSHVYCSLSASSNNQYNGNITVASNGAGCDGIFFGNSGGSSTLSDGGTINIDAVNGFTEGYLTLKNFTQAGTTPQTLNLNGNGKLYIYTSTWGGNISFIAPSIYLNSSVYNGTVIIEKTGSMASSSYGGNTYNKAASIENSGSGLLKLADKAGNDYNEDVTFIRSGTKYIRPAYNFKSTLSGNLNINTNATFYIGHTIDGWFEFDGNTAQSINNTDASKPLIIRRMRVNNSTNEITLNTPLRINNNLDLINGNIITSNTNTLRMNNDAVVDNVSDNSYIDGPIEKIGDNAFVFPTGGTDSYGNSHYAGIGISAPSTNHNFTAEYHAAAHTSATTYSDPLTKVSLVEYWTLRGNSTVDVSLYWNNGTRSGIGKINDLRVAHWNGSTWEDKGNDETSGNASNGSITVNGVSSFSPFTFGTVDNEQNPLPINLINFNALKYNESVKLEWSTASEENNDFFIIERTADFRDISAIGSIDGAGNSNTILNYETIDYSPLEGKSYYRLIQVDYDGGKEYFDWKMVDFSKDYSEKIIIYPNPTDNGITNVSTQGIEGAAIIEIMDVNAKVIYRKHIIINNNTSFPIDLNLSSGIYFIRVMDNNSVYNKKWIIK